MSAYAIPGVVLLAMSGRDFAMTSRCDSTRPRAAARWVVGTVAAMDAVTLSELLAPHIQTGWEHVAEIARPGTAAKVAAVRAGATVRDLSAHDAARAVLEAPDPAQAVAGETRATVLAVAAGSTRHRSPTAQLFDGTPEQVAANLEERKSITDSMIDAYLDATEAVRAVSAATMVKLAESRGIAAVLCERADTLSPAAFTNWVLVIFAEIAAAERALGASSGPRNRSNPNRERERLTRQRARIDAATVAALRAWLEHHGGAGHGAKLSWPGQQIPTVTATPTEASGDSLAVLAAVRGHRLTGPTHLGRAALAAYTSGEVGIPLTYLARIAADTDVPWPEVRAAVYGDAPLGDDGSTFSFSDLVHLADAVTCDGDPRYGWAAQMLRCELEAPVECTPGYYDQMHALLPHVAGELGVPAALRAAALAGVARYAWSSVAHGESFRELVELGHLSPAAVDEAVAQDPVIATYVHGAVVASLTGRVRVTPRLWRYVATYATTAELAEASRSDDSVAERWAELLSSEVERHVADGADRAVLWSAVLTLASTLSQSTADTVALAAATITA